MSFKGYSKLDGFVFDLQRHDIPAITLSGIVGSLYVGEPSYYKADGSEGSEGDYAYKLTKTTNDPTYILESTANANTGLNINATGVSGLTVDLSLSSAAINVIVGSGTNIAEGSKLGATCVVRNSDSTKIATATASGGTFSVTDGTITLSSGTFAADSAGVNVSTTGSGTVTFGSGDAKVEFGGTDNTSGRYGSDGYFELTYGNLLIGSDVERKNVGGSVYKSDTNLKFYKASQYSDFCLESGTVAIGGGVRWLYAGKSGFAASAIYCDSPGGNAVKVTVNNGVVSSVTDLYSGSTISGVATNNINTTVGDWQESPFTYKINGVGFTYTPYGNPASLTIDASTPGTLNIISGLKLEDKIESSTAGNFTINNKVFTNVTSGVQFYDNGALANLDAVNESVTPFGIGELSGHDAVTYTVVRDGGELCVTPDGKVSRFNVGDTFKIGNATYSVTNGTGEFSGKAVLTKTVAENADKHWGINPNTLGTDNAYILDVNDDTKDTLSAGFESLDYIPWTTPGTYFVKVDSATTDITLKTAVGGADFNEVDAATANSLLLQIKTTVNDGNVGFEVQGAYLAVSDGHGGYSYGTKDTDLKPLTGDGGAGYTGTIKTGALAASDGGSTEYTYAFDAQYYKLDTTGILGNVTVSNLGDDDTISVLSGKTFTLSDGFTFTAGGDTTFTHVAADDTLPEGYAIGTAGAGTVTTVSNPVVFYVADKNNVSAANEISIKGTVNIDPAGDAITGLTANSILKSGVAGTVTTELAASGLYTINGVGYTVTPTEADTDGVTFTPVNTNLENGGASAVASLKTGAKLSFNASENKTITVNTNGKFKFGVAGQATSTAVEIVSAGDTEANLTKGIVKLANGGDYAAAYIAHERQDNSWDTSTVSAGENTSFTLTLDGTSSDYTITNIASSEANPIITVDNKTYTLDAGNKILTDESRKKYLLSDASNISFTFQDGPGDDTLKTGTYVNYYGNLATDSLSTIANNITADSATVFFDADGNQQFSSTDSAYTFTKVAGDSPSYTLTSSDKATESLDISVGDTINNLTVNLSANGGTVENPVVNTLKLASAGTNNVMGTLAAGGIVANSTGTAIATAKAANSTFNAAGPTATLTSGSFYAAGEVDVDSNAHQVVITDSAGSTLVTFTAGAANKYNQSTSVATLGDSGAVNTNSFTGKVNTDTEYSLNGATATFTKGALAAVTGFTAGQIEFVTVDGQSFTIGGQTISDVDVATTLTFKSNGANDKVFLVESGAAIKLHNTEAIKIAHGDFTKTSVIAVTGGDGITLNVNSNGTYKLGGLDENDKFNVDGKGYTVKTVNGVLCVVDDSTGARLAADTLTGNNINILETPDIVLGALGFALGSETFTGIQDGFDKETATTLYYNATGNLVATNEDDTKKEEAVVVVTRSSTSANDNYRLTATGAYTSGSIGIVDVSVSVTDSTGLNTYDFGDADTNTITVNGSFSSDAGYTLKAATGTISVSKGSINTVSNTALYDVTADSTYVTFVAGNALSSAKFKTRGGVVTITESNNTTDTKVYYDGHLTGLDGDVNVTGVPANVNISTTGSGTVSLNGTSFTTDNDGIIVSQDSAISSQLNITGLAAGKKITNVTAGKAIKIGTNDPITGLSSGAVLYNDGSVTLSENQYASVNYGGTITNTGSTEIKVTNDGSISTAGGNISVEGAYEGKTVTTAADGKATINGRSYTLSNDSNGITYTATTSGISAISGLANGATLKLEGKFSDGSLTDDDLTLTFTGISSVDGVSFTKNGASYNVGLDRKGEALTVGSVTYKLDINIGSIMVDSGTGTVTGITEGMKVTIVDTANGTTTYEVKAGILVITDGRGSTVTYKQVDSSTPFGVIYDSIGGTSTVVPGTYSTDVTEQIPATGLRIGGTNVAVITNGMYVDKDGKATTDSTKAMAGITISDNGDEVRYESMTDRAQQIDVNAGTVAATKEWDITTKNGGDIINLTSTRDSIVKAGGGKNKVNIASSGDTTVKTGTGNDNINVTGSGDALVETDGGKNRISHTGTGMATLKGGSGNDTISSSNEDDIIELGGGENTLKMTNGVTNAISDYKYGSDKLSLASTTGKLSMDKIKVTEDGTISYGTGDGTVKVGDGQSFYAATLADADGKNKVNVGWTGEDGGTIDASSETRSLVLIGDQNGDGKDILIGGKGRDVIYAGEGDSITGGEGRNEIHLSGSGIAVGFGSTGAKDEVTGFMTGFDESEADNILIMDNSVVEDLKLSFDGKDAVLRGGNTKMTLDSIQKNTSTNAAELLIGGAKVAAIEKGTTANITEAGYADVYFGTGSAGVNFEAVSDDLTIDLSDKTRFRNITSVTGGTGNTLLMGGGSKVTLVSGGGNTSLWGGTGNAMLVGARDSRDEFFFFGESGRDTVSGFTAGTDGTSDVVNLLGSPVTDIRTTNKGVEISTSENSKVIIQGLGANDKFQWVNGEARGVLKVGSKNEANNFTYEADVNNYLGGNKSDTLSVSGESNSVWLDGVGSSIEVIDASNSTGSNLIAGSSESQTIKGGRGNNSLWGGAGGNDILTGGGSYNEFYFGMGEGNDIITQSNDTDKVMLYNVKVSDLDAAGMKDGNMVIALKDGSSLTIQNYDRQGATTFQLADGTYSYDKSTGTWNESK